MSSSAAATWPSRTAKLFRTDANAITPRLLQVFFRQTIFCDRDFPDGPATEYRFRVALSSSHCLLQILREPVTITIECHLHIEGATNMCSSLADRQKRQDGPVMTFVACLLITPFYGIVGSCSRFVMTFRPQERSSNCQNCNQSISS
jgi:hypothetical protein